MKHSLIALALTASFAAPAFAASHSADMDPTCSTFMAMSEADRVKVVQQLVSAMPGADMPDAAATPDGTISMEEMGAGAATGGTMANDSMATDARTACESNPSSTVGEVLQAMKDG